MGPPQRSVPRKRKRNSKARATVYTCIRNPTQRPMLGGIAKTMPQATAPPSLRNLRLVTYWVEALYPLSRRSLLLLVLCSKGCPWPATRLSDSHYSSWRMPTLAWSSFLWDGTRVKRALFRFFGFKNPMGGARRPKLANKTNFLLRSRRSLGELSTPITGALLLGTDWVGFLTYSC